MLICWNDIKIHLGFEDSYLVPPPTQRPVAEVHLVTEISGKVPYSYVNILSIFEHWNILRSKISAFVYIKSLRVDKHPKSKISPFVHICQVLKSTWMPWENVILACLIKVLVTSSRQTGHSNCSLVMLTNCEAKHIGHWKYTKRVINPTSHPEDILPPWVFSRPRGRWPSVTVGLLAPRVESQRLYSSNSALL